MICIWTVPNAALVLKKVGGLSLLERAALTLHSLGIKKVVVPLALMSAVEKIQKKHARLSETHFVSADFHSPGLSDEKLEWNLAWVVWPYALSEFLAASKGKNAQLYTSEQKATDLKITSVSGLDFEKVSASNPTWPLMQVNSEQDLPRLAKSFYRALSKVTDGFVSKHFNRPVSIAVSSVLVRVGVTPSMMTTFCILLTVFAAILAISPNPWYLAIAGVLFHLASTLDGCDGEIARLTFTGTEWGAWYDTLGDNARYGFFFACLGIRSYNMTQNPVYIWTLAAFVPLMIYFVLLNSRYLVATKSGGTFLVMATKVVTDGKKSKSLWDRVITPLQPFSKLDVQAFAVMVMCTLGFPQIMFFTSVVGLVFMTFSTIRTVSAEQKRLNTKITNHWAFFFLVMGSFVLVYIFREVPIHEIREALKKVGWGVLGVFCVAPIWYFFNALALWTLCHRRVSWTTLYYNHWVGESYNNILPLAGMAGEPFKVKHLSQYLSTAEALRVIVQDKLLNAQAGTLFIIALGCITLAYETLDNHWHQLLVLSVFFMATAFCAILYVMLAARPMDFVLKVLAKLGFKKEMNLQKIDASTYLTAFSFRFLGRVVGLAEVALILYLLELPYGWVDTSFVAFVLSASGLIFFMVPQGIGVNELGVAGAFQVLGWSTPLGLALALVRRARITVTALLGITIHLLGSLFAIAQSKAPQTRANSN